MEYTKQLASFCAGISYDRLSPEVIEKTKHCVLDYVANVYGSLELDAVQHVVSLVKDLGTGGHTSVHGCGFSSDMHHASFINGTAAEAIEAQDGVRFGGNHPGVAVIPAALAVGEERRVTGKALIEAVVAGYEAANRPSAAMHPWHTLSGFLPTGTCGTFGAAAAAGRLRGFDAEKMGNALGNAGYLLPISMAEQLMGGYTIKIVQGGQAALSGLMAAGLAERGVTGAPYTLEGSALNGGFTQITTSSDPNLEKLVDGLGENFSIMDVYFKPYTACRHTHGAAQAALAIRREAGFSLEHVEEISVFTYGIAELAVGKGVDAGSSFVSAQFSIPYVVAVCLLDGELGPLQLTEKRVSDEDVLALAKKVTVQTEDELNSVYPEKTSSRVEIAMRDSEPRVQQVDIPKGDPRDPMDASDIAAKVRRFAGERDMSALDTVIDIVLDLENLDDVGEIAQRI